MTEDSKKRHNSPLADRMRPNKLDDFLGQEDIVGSKKCLGRRLNLTRCLQ